MVNGGFEYLLDPLEILHAGQFLATDDIQVQFDPVDIITVAKIPAEEVIEFLPLAFVELYFLVALPGQELKISLLVEQSVGDGLDDGGEEMRLGGIEVGEMGNLQVVEFLLTAQSVLVVKEIF